MNRGSPALHSGMRSFFRDPATAAAHPLKTLVLGIGNVLLGDDGVGIHAVRELLKNPLPFGAEVLDAGTAPLDALSFLEKAERILVVDAMAAQGPPGTLYRIPLKRCRRSPVAVSMHGFDLFRVADLAGGDIFSRVLVFGVEPARIGWSLELSPPVRVALPLLIRSVRKEMEMPESGEAV